MSPSLYEQYCICTCCTHEAPAEMHGVTCMPSAVGTIATPLFLEICRSNLCHVPSSFRYSSSISSWQQLLKHYPILSLSSDIFLEIFYSILNYLDYMSVDLPLPSPRGDIFNAIFPSLSCLRLSLLESSNPSCLALSK